MIVPLVARGRSVGAITLVTAESGRTYDENDLKLAEAVAVRTAAAIDRSRLRDEVEQSEGRFETLVESLGAIVWEADAQAMQPLFVSRHAEELLGHATDRWVKEAGFWETIIHPDDREVVIERRGTSARGGSSYEIEYRASTVDGRTLWLRELGHAVPDDGGVRLRGIMVDVTQRVLSLRRAEALHAITRALAESQTLGEAGPEILRAVCETLHWDLGALWSVDPAADVLRCEATWNNPEINVAEFVTATRSRTFVRGVGLPGRVWASGLTAWISDVGEDDNFPRGPVAGRLGLHGACGFPIVLRGQVLGVVEFFSREIREPDDSLRRMTATIGTQIGQFIEAGEATAALRESHVRTRAILSSALDCVVSMDRDGRILEFNPAAEQTFGYLRADVIGKELAELIIPPAHRDAHRTALRRYIETGASTVLGRRRRLTGMRKDGSEFPVEVAIAAVENSEPPTFTGFIRDVTEEVAAEQALAESRERLAFIANASDLLSSSLDYRTVLQRLASLAVPTFADWCAVDVVEEGRTLRRVAISHRDPSKAAAAERFKGLHTDEAQVRVLQSVLKTGQPLLDRDGAQVCATSDPQRRALLRELGVGSAIIIPLVARGRTLGAMKLVLVPGGRTYGIADVPFAQDIARRAALAVDNARLYQDRSHVARTLQRSLLPPSLPQIPGLEVAARYHAAGEGNEVGGDFYDVFRTGRDDWAILIGDVCGKGADAAALTALSRYTVRAAAMQARKPSRVLAQLNDAILSESTLAVDSDQRFCTVAYARLRPVEDGVRLTVTSGGHPIPLVLRANGRVDQACRPGTLIGVVPNPVLTDRSSILGTGDTLILYTDGVTEARGPDGVLGEEGFHRLVSSCAGLDAHAIAERIESAVLDFQEGNLRDDIALVVARAPL